MAESPNRIETVGPGDEESKYDSTGELADQTSQQETARESGPAESAQASPGGNLDEEVSRLRTDLSKLRADMRNVYGALRRESVEQAAQARQELREGMEERYRRMRQTLGGVPLRTALVALGVGFTAASLLRRRGR